jgi:tRNA pseudouridine-54 N-methylase
LNYPHVIALINEVPPGTPKSITAPDFPGALVWAARLISTTFLLSNDIRRTPIFHLYASDDQCHCEFVGSALRFLSPDERTTVSLLLKVGRVTHGTSNKRADQRIQSLYRAGERVQVNPGVFAQQCPAEGLAARMRDQYPARFDVSDTPAEADSIPIITIHDFQLSPETLQALESSLLVARHPGALPHALADPLTTATLRHAPDHHRLGTQARLSHVFNAFDATLT